MGYVRHIQIAHFSVQCGFCMGFSSDVPTIADADDLLPDGSNLCDCSLPLLYSGQGKCPLWKDTVVPKARKGKDGH